VVKINEIPAILIVVHVRTCAIQCIWSCLSRLPAHVTKSEGVPVRMRTRVGPRDEAEATDSTRKVAKLPASD
jgi:hypothetical protein